MPRSRKAQAIRSNSEFNLSQLARLIVPPRANSQAYAWDLETIKLARDDQMRGSFARPAQLARAFRTDDALYSAWQTRMSPEAAIAVDLEPANGIRGESIGAEGEALFGQHGIGLRPETRQDILDDMINCGLGISQNRLKPREDGSRVDIEVVHWPIEHVRWDDPTGRLMTRVAPETGLLEVPITHGDGTWTVFAKTRTYPWTKHAAVLPAALVWSRHAFGIKDWTSASYSHGNTKVTGEMPPEMAFVDENGNLTPQALGFSEILRAITSSEALAGLIPPGAKVAMLANPSTAHQIWTDIVLNSERAAMRIYCGTDAALGSPGGAPGVDILTLFGVSNTIGEGDLSALARGFQEGVVDVWAAINFGDSSLAPRFRYVVPNPDEQTVRVGYAARMAAFLDALLKMQTLGIEIKPDMMKLMADRYGVDSPV